MIMKNVLMFMAIMIAVVSLSSCNSFEDKAKKSLENKAKEQLHVTMKELARNPETYKIENEKVIFSSDSMCTISFVGSGQNGLGRYSTSRMEYTIVKCKDDKYCETLLNMENQFERMLSIKEEIYNIDNDFTCDSPNVNLSMTDKMQMSYYDDNIMKGMSKEDAKANDLYVRAMAILFTIGGREIGGNGWGSAPFYQLNVSEDLSYPQEHFKLYAKKI